MRAMRAELPVVLGEVLRPLLVPAAGEEQNVHPGRLILNLFLLSDLMHDYILAYKYHNGSELGPVSLQVALPQFALELIDVVVELPPLALVLVQQHAQVLLASVLPKLLPELLEYAALDLSPIPHLQMTQRPVQVSKTAFPRHIGLVVFAHSDYGLVLLLVEQDQKLRQEFIELNGYNFWFFCHCHFLLPFLSLLSLKFGRFSEVDQTIIIFFEFGIIVLPAELI